MGQKATGIHCLLWKYEKFLDVRVGGLVPAVVEPFFLAFNASVKITPVMTAEDLMKGAQGIEEAVKKYA